MNPDANRARYPTRRRPGLLLLLPVLVVLGLLQPALAKAPNADSPAADSPAADSEGLLQKAEQALAKRDLYEAARVFTTAAESSTDAAIAERATQLTFGLGFDALAERAVERWVVLAPENSLPRILLGRLKLRRHAVDEAAAHLLSALGPGEPRRDEVYLALAADLSAEDATLVTRVLSRLAALDPLAPGLQQALGSAALRSGDYELALGAAQAASIDDPEWPDPQLLMARALAALGRGDEAVAKVAAMVAADPGPLTELEYARLLADAGQVVEARAQLAVLATKYGDRPEITRTLAFLDLAEGDLDAADQRFDALDDGGPARLESFYYRAQIAARKGDDEAAHRWYIRVSSGPYLVPAQIASAGHLARTGRGEEALAQLSQFAYDHPTQAFEVLEFRAQLLQSLQRPAAALAVYDEALRYKPASVAILLSRGALLEQQGRVRAALADLEAAADIAPDNATVLNAYGYILANRTGKARKAWRLVRRAYEIQAESPAIQDSVGWTLFRLGRLEEARSHLEEAAGVLADPEITSHLAEVTWALGERDAAADILRFAAAAWPDSKPVRDTAARLLN